MSDFNKLQNSFAEKFEKYASSVLSVNYNTEKTLFESMKYSFFAGGKRVRPTLMLACAEMLGVDEDRILPFAFALECVHTYSLIHDDLPAMDNDDYRRGKLTNHKVYGEACAILAGDALLNLAFSVCAKQCLTYRDEQTARAACLLSDFAGFEGMIAGQSLDILTEENKSGGAEELDFIEQNKTGKLIAASMIIPCILAGKDIDVFSRIGFLLGKQFQIIDDILDVESNLEALGKSVGKDEKSGKLTFVSLYGLNEAKNTSRQLRDKCIDLLSSFEGSEFLIEYCNFLLSRVY